MHDSRAHRGSVEMRSPLFQTVVLIARDRDLQADRARLSGRTDYGFELQVHDYSSDGKKRAKGVVGLPPTWTSKGLLPLLFVTEPAPQPVEDLFEHITFARYRSGEYLPLAVFVISGTLCRSDKCERLVRTAPITIVSLTTQ
jgi:hypothetical protein